MKTKLIQASLGMALAIAMAAPGLSQSGRSMPNTISWHDFTKVLVKQKPNSLSRIKGNNYTLLYVGNRKDTLRELALKSQGYKKTVVHFSNATGTRSITAMSGLGTYPYRMTCRFTPAEEAAKVPMIIAKLNEFDRLAGKLDRTAAMARVANTGRRMAELRNDPVKAREKSNDEIRYVNEGLALVDQLERVMAGCTVKQELPAFWFK